MRMNWSSDADAKKVAIVGATGAVGMEILTVLTVRKFPLSELKLFASARSAGKTVTSSYGELVIEEFSVERAREMDIVFLAVSGTFSLEHARQIALMPGGAVVIDNSSALRLAPDVPLIVPEINGHQAWEKTLIANPNCTTAIAAMALWPLHCHFGLKKIIMSTYQAASGAGQEGIDELKRGTEEHLQGHLPQHHIFTHALPFNVIPHIDAFQDNGYTKEEMKVTWETRKIFDEPQLAISCTAVRVPTIRAHAESISIETQNVIDVEEARGILSRAPGLQVVDDPQARAYPMPLTSSGQDDVAVGRVRQSLIFGMNGLDVFVCGDQLLRGAALNAVLIAETMLAQVKNNGPSMMMYRKKQRRSLLLGFLVDEQTVVSRVSVMTSIVAIVVWMWRK